MGEMKNILILGLGNYLMGDEGIGIHAVKDYRNKYPESVEILDGGTGGFHLLSLFSSYDIMIIVDATLNDDPPGTIKVLEPRYSKDFPKSLSSHDIGLKDLVESASFAGTIPKIYIVAVTVKDYRNVSMGLSPEVKNSIPAIHKKLDTILELIFQKNNRP
jgi:hydrogenase maturation protease